MTTPCRAELCPMWDGHSCPKEVAWCELRGHDLVCWCPLSAPCHADVLLELANEEAPSGARDR